MSLKYIFGGAFLLGTGIGVMMDIDDHNKDHTIANRILQISKTGTACMAFCGGYSMFMWGFINYVGGKSSVS